MPDVVVQKKRHQEQPQPLTVEVAEPKNQPTTVRVPMPVSGRQGFLEVREVATKEVVTAIELLSPVNKRSGRGRQTYETKRLKSRGLR
ncbi:MAG: DUF4058 family protein [Cyanobacteria bacterium J06649_4]